MRIALSIWKDRISPVFDTSRRILLVDFENALESERTQESIDHVPVACRAARLKELGIEVLLCGAISRQLSFLIDSSGIKLVPFLTGEVDEVLEAFQKDELPHPRFMMPGCCGRYRRFRGGCF
jgi:predicted Fe-Mo cluster-binding NifX family protein